MPSVPPDDARPFAKALSPPSRNALHRASLLVPILLIALSGLVLAMLVWQQRDNDIENSRAVISSLAQLVEEQTSRTVQSVALTLEQAETRLARLNERGEATESLARQELRALLKDRPYLRAIWVLDAKGTMIFDTDEGNIGINLADRDYFRLHLADPQAGFEIHTPVLSRTIDRWFISATLPLRDAQGAFSGVIVAAIEPLYFNEVWRIERSQSASLSITLFRDDGTMLMRAPFDGQMMGARFESSPLFRSELKKSADGSYTTVSLVDKKLRLFSYRTIRAKPNLVVSVGETVEQALQSWRRFTIIIAAGWTLAAMILIALGVSLRREWRRRLIAESGLKKSYERVNAILDNIDDGVISIDETGTVRDFRKSAERIFGYAADEVVGQNVKMLMPEPDRTRHDGYIGNYLKSGVRKIIGKGREVVGQRKDGTQFPMELSVAEIMSFDGLEFVGTVRDISTRKAVEEQLRQAQKMEAVGQLTGGVAHDFNNMLTVIIGNADILVEQIPPGTPQHQASKMILSSAEASAELVRRLLAFARRQPLEPRRVAVREFVPKIKPLLTRTLGENIEITVTLASDTWEAMIDPSQLESSILNLAINARDAMPNGGKIIIETLNLRLDGDAAAAQNAVPGDYVVIAVSDNGAGMSADTLSRVFEPFFTTKEVGKGSGLGLSMVYGFVRQSGGYVKIYSEIGHGTTVKLFLPRAKDAAADSAGDKGVTQSLNHRGESILVVEDDPLVRSYVAAQLSNLGYKVTTANNGKEAIAQLESDGKFDLLFTDIVMPGSLTGRDVANKAKELRPHIRVLFTSGYTENAIVHHGRLDPGVHLLSKPYRLHQLAQKIREVLD